MASRTPPCSPVRRGCSRPRRASRTGGATPQSSCRRCGSRAATRRRRSARCGRPRPCACGQRCRRSAGSGSPGVSLLLPSHGVALAGADTPCRKALLRAPEGRGSNHWCFRGIPARLPFGLEAPGSIATAVPATHAGGSIPRFASPLVRQRRHDDSRVKVRKAAGEYVTPRWEGEVPGRPQARGAAAGTARRPGGA